MLREQGIVTQNVSKCSISVFAFEGGSAIKHLIDKDSQGPPVDGAGMATSFNNFWSNILFGTDKRIRAEVGDAGFCIYGREGRGRGTIPADNHGRGATGIRLLGEIKVR